MAIYKVSQPNNDILSPVLVEFGLSYLSISLSLNILLTFMIVIRLVLHSRNIRTTMGAPSGVAGLYKAIVVMLIESSAIYAASSLLYLGPLSSGNNIAHMFLPILAEIQVRAFFPGTFGSLRTFLSDMVAGHRSIAHHSTSCRSECVDEQKCHHQKYQFDQL